MLAVPLCPCTSAVVGQSFPNGSPLLRLCLCRLVGYNANVLNPFPPLHPRFRYIDGSVPKSSFFSWWWLRGEKMGLSPFPVSPLPCKMGPFSSRTRDLRRRERIESNFHFLKAVSLSPPPHLLNFSKKKCSWHFSGSFLCPAYAFVHTVFSLRFFLCSLRCGHRRVHASEPNARLPAVQSSCAWNTDGPDKSLTQTFFSQARNKNRTEHVSPNIPGEKSCIILIYKKIRPEELKFLQ